MSDTETSVVVDDAGDAGDTSGRSQPTGPEVVVDETLQGVEDSSRQLQALQRQRDQEAQRRRQAERDAAAARREVGQMRNQRAQDGRVLMQQAASTAQAEIDAAKQAYRNARETGDLDAEAAAMEAMQQASARKALLDAQVAQMPAEPTSGAGDAAPDLVVVNGRQVTRTTAQWIREHPRFTSDRKYEGVAIQAHNDAVRSGHTVDTPEYFRYIESVLAEEFPDDGDEAPPVRQSDNGGGRSMSTNGGAPPTRHQGGGGNGRTVKTLFGPLIVRRSGSGGMQIQIPAGQRQDWEEAARINNMSLGDYCKAQVDIAEERERGQTGGLITAEGQSFR